MADVLVQRGTSTIASGNATVTITAGSEYAAPAAASKAFIRIVNTSFAGLRADDNSSAPDGYGVTVSHATDITASAVFTRYAAAAYDTVIEWEILEYIGAGGGANEFIVRGVGVVTLGSADNDEDSGAIGSVATDADMVPFITGQRADMNGNTGGMDMHHTAAWNSGADTITFTRDIHHVVESKVSYAAVEWTGSNWTVQRAEHVIIATATTETETISSVGATSRAFIHSQHHRSGANNSAGVNRLCWLSSTTEVSFEVASNAGLGPGKTIVAWVISNSQTGTGEMVVSRYTDTISAATSQNKTITAVAATNATSIMEETAICDETGTGDPGEQVNFKLTTTTNVALYRCRAGLADTELRFAVVEWPSVAGGGSPTLDQSGYQFLEDDAAEGANTPLEAENTPATITPGVPFRLRMQINGTGDPTSKEFQVEYRKVGSGLPWRKVDPP